MRDNRLALLYLRYEGWFMPRGLPSRSHVRRLALSMSWSSLSAGQGIKRRMFDSIRCACAQGVVDLVKKVCFIGFVLADLASSYRGEHTWHGHHTPQECLG